MRKLLFFLEFTFGEFQYVQKVDTINVYFQLVTIIFACFYATLGFSQLNTKFQENEELMDPVQEMINISNNPVLLPRMPFGKHKGMLFSEVPTDYLQWLSGTELDEDMAYTVEHHLGQG